MPGYCTVVTGAASGIGYAVAEKLLSAGRKIAAVDLSAERLKERFGDVTYLVLRLETGRTHQIRVHLSAIGHPLLGDTVYGGGKTAFEKRHADLFDGQCLHAARLTFKHPRTGEETTFSCPLPPDFEKLLAILRRERGGEIAGEPTDSKGEV